jgi:hypothetical protein
MWAWIRSVGAALGLSLAACGGGVLVIGVNSGVVVGQPSCQGSGGQFQLRDQGGLVVVVVITSTTRIIVASGGPGACSALSADTPVQVSGHRSGDRIVASSITIE